MNTKIVMTVSATVMGLIGILLSFVPTDILNFLGLNSKTPYSILLQVLGALYFGFGMLNWMAKGSRIGGIYNRPIVVANFTHFMIGGLALVKASISTSDFPSIFLVLAIVYSIFAVAFGILLFQHPIKEK